MRLLAVLVVLCGAPAKSAIGRHPLPVLWMLPEPSGGGGASAGLKLAVRMALEDLERQAAPLGDYAMQLHVIHAQCDLSSSLKAVFDAMWAGPKFPLLLGGACPSVAPRLAGALPALRMVQVSYGDEASGGNVFSVAPWVGNVNLAAVELLRRYGRTRVGLLAGESQMSEDLTRRMTTADMRPVSVTTLPDHDCAGLADMKMTSQVLTQQPIMAGPQKTDGGALQLGHNTCKAILQERDVRVVVVTQADEDSLAAVFCCASRLQMFGARHQWIVAGGEPRWRSGVQAAGCTTDDVAAAAERAIWLPVARAARRSDAPGASGRTPEDFERAYRREVGRHPGVRASPRRAAAYDAVWAAAKALSGLTEALKRRQKFSRKAEVSQAEAARALRDALARTHFQGVTGTISFQRGRRRSSVHVIQTQGSASVLVGQLDTKTRELRVSRRLLKFQGSSAPRAHVERRRVSLLVYAGLSVVAAATAAISLGVLYALGAREALPLTAVVLSAASVAAVGPDDDDLVAPETTRALCTLRACLLVASHSLASTWLLAQTWRRLAGDARLPSAFRLASALTSADALLLAAWQTLAPLGMPHGGTQSEPARPDAITWTTCRRCSGNDTDAWAAVIYAYKAPLMACGSLLSWLLPDDDGGACAWWPRVCAGCAWWACTWAAAAPPLQVSNNPSLDFCAFNLPLLACDIVIIVIVVAAVRGRLGDSGAAIGRRAAGGGARDNLHWQLQLQSIELDAQMHTLSAQLCDEWQAERGQRRAGSSDVTSRDVNSPELVRRRVSLQLPILHLSYLAAIGGVSASDSAHLALTHA